MRVFRVVRRSESGDTVLSPPSSEEAQPPVPRAGRALGDFTIDRGVWAVLVLSVLAGAVSAGVALGLLDLIGLITHLLYFGNAGVSLVQPSLRHLGAFTVLIPIGGGLVIGAMAYWGSERIRGHGIPEAMETTLVGSCPCTGPGGPRSAAPSSGWAAWLTRARSASATPASAPSSGGRSRWAGWPCCWWSSWSSGP